MSGQLNTLDNSQSSDRPSPRIRPINLVEQRDQTYRPNVNTATNPNVASITNGYLNSNNSSVVGSRTNSGANILHSPNLRARSSSKLRKKSRPHLKRITSGVNGGHSKLVFSVDDDIGDDVVAIDIKPEEINSKLNDRDYFEGYSDALKVLQKRGKNSSNNSAPGTPIGYFPDAGSKIDQNNLKTDDINNYRPQRSTNKSTIESNTLSNLQSGEEKLRLTNANKADKAYYSDNNISNSNEDEIIEEIDETEEDIEDINDTDSMKTSSSNETIESLNLRERQNAINSTHPFGIKIWKPSLYKKNRSVAARAQEDIHDFDPQKTTENIFWGVFVTNLIWSLTIGLALFLVCTIGAIFVFLFSGFAYHHHLRPYVKLLFKLGRYWFSPFGKFVLLNKDKNYLDEDELDGRSISEFERWRLQEEGRLFFAPPRRYTSGNDESRPLMKDHKGRALRDAYSSLGETSRQNTNVRFEQNDNDNFGNLNNGNGANNTENNSTFEDELDAFNSQDDEDEFSSGGNDIKVRFFGRGSWSTGRLIFYLFFYGILQPILFLIGIFCWLFVFTIPMANITNTICDHLRRHPLALHFELEKNYYDKLNDEASLKTLRNQSIILCTYRCCGFHYYKYTIDGTNIFFINLLAAVVYVIFDYFVLKERLHWNSWYTDSTFLFCACLFSIIPLAYFIGQAVASISAQSSMGVGAVINAFFSTVVEIFLYCVALNQGKGKLVEGSMIGSILGGVLLLPGLSMCGGAFKRKTQRYNPRSAGVSSTMLLFAMVIMFAPSFFYQLYGPYEIKCKQCAFDFVSSGGDDCVKCRFIQPSFALDALYYSIVKPFSVIVACALFLAYVCGLFFTLRTHASLIWATNSHEQAALNKKEENNYMRSPSIMSFDTPQQLPKSSKIPSKLMTLPPSASSAISSSTDQQQNSKGSNLNSIVTTALPSPYAEVAKNRYPKNETSKSSITSPNLAEPPVTPMRQSSVIQKEPDVEEEGGGHDAPNWSRNKSTVILLGATLLYAIIAEILVDNVDAVLSDFPINPKFLGLTVFALVPNTTEFLNAISFAVGGNVALSMEIGSAYALQVVLIQIPSLVVYSILKGFDDVDKIFSLIFPRWDIIATLIAIYLFTYVYAEGKSNYFKGVILMLSYFVVLIGFWLNDQVESLEDGYTGGPSSHVATQLFGQSY